MAEEEQQVQKQENESTKQQGEEVKACPKLEQIKQMKKQVEDMRSAMAKMSTQSQPQQQGEEEEGKEVTRAESQERTLFPFRFDDFFWSTNFWTKSLTSLNRSRMC